MNITAPSAAPAPHCSRIASMEPSTGMTATEQSLEAADSLHRIERASGQMRPRSPDIHRRITTRGTEQLGERSTLYGTRSPRLEASRSALT